MRINHLIGTIAILLLLTVAPWTSQARDNDMDSLKMFSEVLHLIEDNYVEEKDREDLIRGAIQGMLRNLDPHSSYVDLDQLRMMQEDFEGKFGGIGIQIGIRDGNLVVISPIEGTPAYEAGLEPGDVIMEIEGEPTQDMALTDAVNKIRGPKGEPVELTILSEGSQSPEKVKIVRDDIPVHSVKSQELESGYLHLRITDFKATTTEDLKEEIRKYSSEKEIKGIVLDLRNNPGGLLDQAVSVSDIFLDDGLIVYTQGREEAQRKDYSATSSAEDVTSPMVVLINAGSASGSEIVAGALQDRNRALLLGEPTFGKGSVQSILPVADGSAIKLTIANYYTPDGRSIEAEGVAPDIHIPHRVDAVDEDEQQQEMQESMMQFHIDQPDERPDDEEERYSEEVQKLLDEDNQLRMALELLRSMPRIQELSYN
ncbi:carboxyl-terminal protease [Desulfonatronospira thiodismutans ASO3-1]|uniref:Carboxyl-terminal protease n=1 Tax=Desulfonatronospira thiodismutans ASO3-1 TaxID=555779 RepID=D6SS31_9BACT|nr:MULTISPECIES: S41 family peptidase [Desulfonatronospira]EFI33497.1 carboxyl-terminal protease [Desulfonatronospira thiodismutans ASO3-1]RQD74145.1 MAG: S41 family peptidase [Desulfonatronospira sp. MSAO_Bac3]